MTEMVPVNLRSWTCAVGPYALTAMVYLYSPATSSGILTAGLTNSFDPPASTMAEPEKTSYRTVEPDHLMLYVMDVTSMGTVPLL